MEDAGELARLRERWGLQADGAAFRASSGWLQPVRDGTTRTMLKLALEPEEVAGAALMAWWAGDGAARVLRHDGPALLLERADGPRALAAMARGGEDDAASRILCAAAARLHRPRPGRPPALVPLADWFAALEPAAARHGGLLPRAASIARSLLADPQQVMVLHGDLHHGNVLDAGPRGWVAIDPKGLIGERGFDFANLLRNPDAELALRPGRLGRQATVIAEAAGLDRHRLLQWTLAFAGLSAGWIMDDGDRPDLDLAVAALAAAELG